MEWNSPLISEDVDGTVHLPWNELLTELDINGSVCGSNTYQEVCCDDFAELERFLLQQQSPPHVPYQHEISEELIHEGLSSATLDLQSPALVCSNTSSNLPLIGIDNNEGFDNDKDIQKAVKELKKLQTEYNIQLQLVDMVTSNGKEVTTGLQKNVSSRKQDVIKKIHEIETMKQQKRTGSFSPTQRLETNIVIDPIREEDNHEEMIDLFENHDGQLTIKNSNQDNTKRKQRQYYKYAKDPIKGNLYNPVTFCTTFDLLNPSRLLPDGSFKEYTGHMLPSAPNVLKVIVTNTDIEKKVVVCIDQDKQGIYTLDKSKIFNVHIELPLIENKNGIEYYGVPKTPKSAYTTRLPKELQDKPEQEVDIRLHERVFITVKNPIPDRVKMQVGPSQTLNEIKDNLIHGGFSDIVMTVRDEPLSELSECDFKNGLVNLMLLPEHALSVRKYFEAQGLIVYDNMYRYQGLSIFFEKKEELARNAIKHISEKKAMGWTDFQITMSVEFPLRTYVVRSLRDEGSILYTHQFVDRYQKQLYDQGPYLSQAQTEQLLDAYYWHSLAPIEHRINFSSVIKYFSDRGRVVRLKNPYQPSGRDVGRSVSLDNGELRFHSSESITKRSFTAVAHSVLPSKYVTQDFEGNFVAKKIHPRPYKQKKSLSKSLLGESNNSDYKKTATGTICRFMQPKAGITKQEGQTKRTFITQNNLLSSRRTASSIPTTQPIAVVADFLTQSLKVAMESATSNGSDYTLPNSICTNLSTEKRKKTKRRQKNFAGNNVDLSIESTTTNEIPTYFTQDTVMKTDTDIKLLPISNTEESVIVEQEGSILEGNSESLNDVNISEDELVDEQTSKIREVIHERYMKEDINFEQKKRLWNQTIPDNNIKRKKPNKRAKSYKAD